jgi:8-oxo-dGTP pyrophosphatase MutT (NUDIX family)
MNQNITRLEAANANGTLIVVPRITARLLIEKQGEYLYLVQTNERGGAFSLPGGRVKTKEFTKKALIREVFEETNLTIDKKSIQFIHTLHKKEDGTVEICFFFHVVIEDFLPLALNEPHKFKEFVWIPKQEVPNKLIKDLRYVLQRIQIGKIFSEYPKKNKMM